MEQSPNTLLTFPTAEEMQRILRQSGILDKTTIFPDKKTPGMESAAQLQQVELARAQADVVTEIGARIEFSWVRRYIPKIVGFLLTLQSLKGIYDSVYFILVEYPELEIALEQHLIETQLINDFAAKAAITAVSTVISMIFALRLTIMKTKAAKVISTLIGIGMIFVNTFIQQYFSELNSGIIFSDYSAHFLEEATRNVEELVPLEEIPLDQISPLN
jgi:hypothetical protein